MAVASGAFAEEQTEFGDDEVAFYTDDGGPLPLPESYPQAAPRKYTFGKSIRHSIRVRIAL